MAEEIHNPLRDYRETYRDRFAEAAGREFDRFAAEAGVDVEANRATCRRIAELGSRLDDARGLSQRLTLLSVLLWIAIAADVALCYYGLLPQVPAIAIGVALALWLVFWVYRRMRAAKKIRRELGNAINAAMEEAYAQMESLNSLYDDAIFHRLVNETAPILSLDPYLKAADMQVFEEEGSLGCPNNSAAVDLQSGKINGNPFYICRNLVHTMGSKTYYGSRTVSVRKFRTVNGRTESYTAMEVLTAHVTRPYPEYSRHTELVYANQAAPELIFTRRKNRFSNKTGSLSYRFTRWRLKRKAAKMDKDFALMTNEDFEILFTTDNRNNNQQYALLFTPVAQANMLDLLRDSETGYGDDFSFTKVGRVNTIDSDHLQTYSLDWSPAPLRQYEYDRARDVFVNTNLERFHGLYFALAPLLSIPLYQQMPPDYDVRLRRPPDDRCHTLQQEATAYFWGQSRFSHPDCVTDCILKTDATHLGDGSTVVDVTAYGYRTEPRVTYVPVRASDGRCHEVPVHWEEFIPVEGRGSFSMKETPEAPADLGPRGRLENAAGKLKDLPGAVLFRNIATRLLSAN